MATSETETTPGSLAIVGAGGVLGAKLVERALAESDARIYAFTHGVTPAIPAAQSNRIVWQPLDIADADAVADALSAASPSVVINSAAMTNVDACQSHPEEALAANTAGPRHLAAACARLGARLVHVSTDYVFPGDDRQPGPYVEDAPVRPVNYYGWTKLQGEQAIADVCADRVPWLVARTALVYGYVPGGRTNFITWLASELRAGRRVKIVHDQINTPTLADDLAAALLHLAYRDTQGIIHVAGPDLISRDAWARAIAAHYTLDESLIDILSTAELNQPAQRPLRSGLQTGRSQELTGVILRGITAGLEALGAYEWAK